MAIAEKGNPMFNLSQADTVNLPDDVFKIPETPTPDLREVDKMILEKKKDAEPAMSAVTAEHLAFEAELQRMSREEVIATSPRPVEKEITSSEFLGEIVPGYQPAKTLNELEQQVFMAKQHGANSIEASEEIVKYYTRNSFSETQRIGYFMFKDVKVFIPGKFSTFVSTDSKNLNRITIPPK